MPTYSHRSDHLRNNSRWRYLASISQLILQWLLVVTILFSLFYWSDPDPGYAQLGKHPSTELITSVSQARLQNHGWWEGYQNFLSQTLHWDFGASSLTGRNVITSIGDAIQVSLLLLIPPFVLGHVLSFALAAWGVLSRSARVDDAIRWFSAFLLSLSILVVMVALQWAFSAPEALNWLPARGWSTATLSSYLRYAFTPSLVIVVLVVAVYTRFYRSMMVEQWAQEYCRYARELGVSRFRLLRSHVWPNIRAAVMTRALITLPPLLCGGAFVIERFFGVPGMGSLAYDAFLADDIPLASALLVITATLLLIVQHLLDLFVKNRQASAVIA